MPPQRCARAVHLCYCNPQLDLLLWDVVNPYQAGASITPEVFPAAVASLISVFVLFATSFWATTLFITWSTITTIIGRQWWERNAV